MKTVADSVKLAIADLLVVLLAFGLAKLEVASFSREILLLALAPVMSVVAVVYAVKEILRARQHWIQPAMSILLAMVPFVVIGRIRF